MSRANTWTNSDGLIVGYGQHTSDNNVAGQVRPHGAVKTVVVEIVATELVDTFAAANVKPQAVTIPRGAWIKSATLHVHEAFASSGAGTLDIGTWGKSAAVVDVADGIDADIAVAAMNAEGEVVVCNGTLVGATLPVGGTSNCEVVIAPSYETAVFQSGKASLVVEYIEPLFDGSIAA